jgi:hypothetical protein
MKALHCNKLLKLPTFGGRLLQGDFRWGHVSVPRK